MSAPEQALPPCAEPGWDELPCPVCMIDAQGRVLLGNQAWAGWAAEPGEPGQPAEPASPADTAADTTAHAWPWLQPQSRAEFLAALAAGADFELALACERSRCPSLPPASHGQPAAVWLACRARWQPQRAAYVCVWQDISVARRAEQAAREQALVLAAQTSQLRLVADNVPVLLAFYDARSFRCRFANRQYAQAFGMDERSIVGRSFYEVIGAEAAAEVQPQVDRLLREQRTVSYERYLPGADPSARPDAADGGRWVEVSLIPHLDGSDRPLACFVMINDITRHRLAELAARESEARLQKFMQASVEGILFHRQGLITDANPPLCALMGYSLEELVGRPVLDFVAEGELSKVGRVMAERSELSYSSQILHRDGSPIDVELIVRSMQLQGESLRMTIVRDIRDRLAAQAQIQHLADHDDLTGLLKRRAFMQELAAAIAAARGGANGLALLFIDLDNFKRVNDSLGHLEGDKVLNTVAARITDCLRASDRVARFGGDEFVILLRDVHSRDDVMVVLMALLAVVEVPVLADGCRLSVTPSIGVALFPEHGDSAEELIQHADMAMYQAKACGRANYQFFDADLARHAYPELVLESELAQALDRGEFELFFQPQVAADDARLLGAEALLRWRHPQRGLLGPGAFIDVAERHRLMLKLGEWVLRAAALQARDWRARGVAAVPLAVNLSRMQFRLDGFGATVARVLAEVGIAGECLELELTERMLMDEIASAPATLAALRELGLSVSVDDFGTGYTSLAHLTRLPLDKLKIDQSFIAPLPGDSGAAAITRAIIEMAHGLGLQVSAEGVRQPAQRELLAAWGCDELQGELIGEPMAVADFELWLQRRRAAIETP